MRKLYETFKNLLIQKRIVSAETIRRDTVRVQISCRVRFSGIMIYTNIFLIFIWCKGFDNNMKSKLCNSSCQTPRLKCTEDKNPISSMTQKMSLAKKMKQQTLDFRYLWSSYTSPGLRAVMSNGAPCTPQNWLK